MKTYPELMAEGMKRTFFRESQLLNINEDDELVELINNILSEFAFRLGGGDVKSIAFDLKSEATEMFGRAQVKSAWAPKNKNLWISAAKEQDISKKDVLVLFNTK